MSGRGDDEALDRYVRELRAFVHEGGPIMDFFPAFMGVVSLLAGPEGLSESRLAVFEALEAWEVSTGDAKAVAAENVRKCAEAIAAPASYSEPMLAWVVQYEDKREPGTQKQVGAFTTEVEARKLIDRLTEDGWRTEFGINLIPVHRTLSDWEWDR